MENWNNKVVTMQGNMVTIETRSALKTGETATIEILSHINPGIILTPMEFRINLKQK
jgi:hypothetical protein